MSVRNDYVRDGDLHRMNTHRLIRSAAGILTAISIIGGVGHASADTIGRSDEKTCTTISPNIVDRPYSVTVRAQQTERPIVHNAITINLLQGVTFLAPYQVTGTVTWHSPVTGQHGTQTFGDTVRRHQFLQPYVNAVNMSALNLHPGVGPLDVTVRVQPHGLFPVGPVSCTQRFTVI